jgi:hypothetical protein
MIRFKGGIQIKISIEQGIYKGKRRTPFKGTYIQLTYTVGKTLRIFLENAYFRFLGNLFRLLKYYL